MHRNIKKFSVEVNSTSRAQILHWLNQFKVCAFFDSFHYPDRFGSYEFLCAAGTEKVFNTETHIFPQLTHFLQHNSDWLFGHCNYNLKNHIENVHTELEDKVGFPLVFFFQPQIVITANNEGISIETLHDDPDVVFKEIFEHELHQDVFKAETINIIPTHSKKDYLRIISDLRNHIHRGDCYEINFCQEFFAEHVSINPLQVYKRLTSISPAPFAAFYKLHETYLLCASPERFIKKSAHKLIAQPMKGTAARNSDNKVKDEENIRQLRNSSKEQSENIMIVDLVRNDLARICKPGSVYVNELFGIYTYAQVHQMVSTVCGELDSSADLANILQATFPIGSMTGAPKKRVLELIENYEQSNRGIFSGSIGYITPHGDFDFNVIIRSIMYSAKNNYLNYFAGSGITFLSNPEMEYNECMIKAAAMKSVLTS